MTIVLVTLTAIAIIAIGLGLTLTGKRNVTVDCATPGQCNKDWKYQRYVK